MIFFVRLLFILSWFPYMIGTTTDCVGVTSKCIVGHCYNLEVYFVWDNPRCPKQFLRNFSDCSGHFLEARIHSRLWINIKYGHMCLWSNHCCLGHGCWSFPPDKNRRYDPGQKVLTKIWFLFAELHTCS